MEREKLRVLFISPKTSIKEAMHKLNVTAKKILFVTDREERLLGTITDGDIRRALVQGIRFTDEVEKIMQQQFIKIDESRSDKKEYAKALILKKGIEQIPILDQNGIIKDAIFWTEILEKEPSRITERFSNFVVIMAGGEGKRLDPFTKILPKPLIPVGEKTIIGLIMEKFSKYGFYRFLYTLNYKKEYLKAFFQENNFPYEIDWVEENDFLGTAGSLSLLKDRLNEPFFVTNCDSLLDIDYRVVLKWHKEYGAAVTIIGCYNEFKIPFGVLEISEGRLQRIMEKPTHDLLINTGIYMMEPGVLSYLSVDRKTDMDELLNLVSQREKVAVFPVFGGWFDIGQWEEYRKTLRYLHLDV